MRFSGIDEQKHKRFGDCAANTNIEVVSSERVSYFLEEGNVSTGILTIEDSARCIKVRYCAKKEEGFGLFLGPEAASRSPELNYPWPWIVIIHN